MGWREESTGITVEETDGSPSVATTKLIVPAGSLTDDGGGQATLDTEAGAYTPGGTDVAVVDGGTGASTVLGAQQNLSLEPGVDVQVYDTELAAFAGLAHTNGDTYYYNSAVQRLAKGNDGDVLTLASGLPSWAAPSGFSWPSDAVRRRMTGGWTGTPASSAGYAWGLFASNSTTANSRTVSGLVDVGPTMRLLSAASGSAKSEFLGFGGSGGTTWLDYWPAVYLQWHFGAVPTNCQFFIGWSNVQPPTLGTQGAYGLRFFSASDTYFTWVEADAVSTYTTTPTTTAPTNNNAYGLYMVQTSDTAVSVVLWDVTGGAVLDSRTLSTSLPPVGTASMDLSISSYETGATQQDLHIHNCRLALTQKGAQ